MLQPLDPRLDVVFETLLSAPDNRELLISLLTPVPRPSSPITSVAVLDLRRPPRSQLAARRCRAA
jgi:hypothetical protein